jgi:hypothetical protein
VAKKNVITKNETPKQKTLFPPYFKNKTTLVAKHNTHPPTLLLYCSFVFHYFRVALSFHSSQKRSISVLSSIFKFFKYLNI